MNCKTILATKTILFSGTVLRITLFICFIGACSLAHAATVTFSGQLDVIEEDRGGAIYSGVALGTDFSGAISDVTFDGFITDGTTQTSFSSESEGALEVTNNEALDAYAAALLNSLAGTSFVEGDLIDFIGLEGDAPTAGGGRIEIGLAFVFDAGTFDDDSLDNYRNGFNPDDILVSFFGIEEEDDQGVPIYAAVGVIDNMTTTPDGFVINPGLNGSWFNPATSGQGFFLDVLPDIPLVFMAWFTYDTTQPAPAQAPQADNSLAKILAAQVGDENHRWLTAQGGFEGDTANLSVFLTTGGLFDDPTPVINTPEGTITLTFKDCTAGTVDYDFTAAGVSGSVPISRLANDNVPLCESFQSNGSALQLISPYVNENEIVWVNPFSFSADSVTGLWHDGIDFSVTTDLSEFQAACSGEVDTIALFKSGDYWQVNISVLCDERYLIDYAFEPMGVRQDGETQLDNIAVSIGQTVSQGDIIGRLHRADEESAQWSTMHFGLRLRKNYEPVCPDQFFTSEAKESILRLIHKDNPDWNMCN